MIYGAADIAIECEHALEQDEAYTITGNVRTSQNQDRAAFELVHEGVRYFVTVRAEPDA